MGNVFFLFETRKPIHVSCAVKTARTLESRMKIKKRVHWKNVKLSFLNCGRLLAFLTWNAINVISSLFGSNTSRKNDLPEQLKNIFTFLILWYFTRRKNSFKREYDVICSSREVLNFLPPAWDFLNKGGTNVNAQIAPCPF